MMVGYFVILIVLGFGIGRRNEDIMTETDWDSFGSGVLAALLVVATLFILLWASCDVGTTEGHKEVCKLVDIESTNEKLIDFCHNLLHYDN